MYRPPIRQQSPSGAGPSPSDSGSQGRFQPAWGFPPTGRPRRSPGGFGNGNRGYGSYGGNYCNLPMQSPRGGPASRPSPYRYSPSQSRGFQGSPQTSPSFRERPGAVEQYYSPAMMQDPWAGLQPVAATDTPQRTGDTSRQRRYF